MNLTEFRMGFGVMFPERWLSSVTWRHFHSCEFTFGGFLVISLAWGSVVLTLHRWHKKATSDFVFYLLEERLFLIGLKLWFFFFFNTGLNLLGKESELKLETDTVKYELYVSLNRCCIVLLYTWWSVFYESELLSGIWFGPLNAEGWS